MKKIVALVLVSGLILAVGMPVQTASAAEENNAVTKLGRGVLNVLDAVVEIPGTMLRTSEAEGAAAGLTKGLFDGAVNTVKRAVVGVYEVGTFPLPLPANYEPILDEPQFLSTK